MPKKPTVSPGDVYVAQAPDGRYGAMRVLRIVDSAVLIYACDYLGAIPPDLADPALRKCVIKHRFSWKGDRAMHWVRGSLPAGLTFIGNVPPTKEEATISCNSYTTWDLRSVKEAYLEWRWIHDRPAYERENELENARRAEEERLRALHQKPKKMMSEEDFWAIIALLDWSKAGDDEQVLSPAITALSKLGKKSIHGFEERLSFLLYQLDTKEHARHIGSESYKEPDGYISADWFLYVRCAAVANGKNVYDQAFKKPELMPKDVEFESLLGLANAAHMHRYEEDMDYETGCNRESFSNLVGWGKT
jgi:hypothetical protein